MRVLVTGANGYLGRHVVRKFLDEGDRVRVVVRPSAALDADWSAAVDVVRADLCGPPLCKDAFEAVETVVHLAATLTGDEVAQFQGTVVATERLLAAMAGTGVKRLVLASSLSVYDWRRARRRLREDSPVETRPYGRDGYAIAKVWQERVVRAAADKSDWELTVLRPGFIWGPGREYVHGVGVKAGGYLLVIGGARRRLPLTHVENCAHYFVRAAHEPKAAGETYNVIDGSPPSAWRFARLAASAEGRVRRVFVPYPVCRALVRTVHAASRLLFHERGKLPSLFIPERFDARFKSLDFSCPKLVASLGSLPPPLK